MSGPVVALVLAAGQGLRLGQGPKAALDLGGRPLVAWSLMTIGACSAVDGVVVVGDALALAPALEQLDAPAAAKLLRVVPGGASREESCARGLAALDPTARLVLVHDAARPFASGALFAAVAAAAERTGAAVPAVPVTDTLKQVTGDRVVETIPRAGLVRAQTPQGARVALLLRAHAAAAATAKGADGAVGTDDVTLIERLGEPVEVVPGEAWNVKITTAEDRAWAEAWLARAGGRGA